MVSWPHRHCSLCVVSPYSSWVMVNFLNNRIISVWIEIHLKLRHIKKYKIKAYKMELWCCSGSILLLLERNRNGPFSIPEDVPFTVKTLVYFTMLL